MGLLKMRNAVVCYLDTLKKKNKSKRPVVRLIKMRKTAKIINVEKENINITAETTHIKQDTRSVINMFSNLKI